MEKEKNEVLYRKALEKWLSEYPGKTVNDLPRKEVVELIIEGKNVNVNLGIRISTIKSILNGTGKGNLTKDQIKYWKEKQGLSLENQKNEVLYRKALEKWLSECSGKTVNDVPQKEVVEIIIDGKNTNIKLGYKISHIKNILNGTWKGNVTEDQIKYWKEKQGLSLEKEKNEVLYRKALEKWLSEYPGKTVNDVLQREVVELIIEGKNVNVNLGSRISIIKSILNGTGKGNVTKDQIKYWKEKQGLSLENKLNMEKEKNEVLYRKALEKWLSEYPGKTVNDVSQREVVEIIIDGKNTNVNLGSKISYIKYFLNGTKKGNLKDDQIKYWVEKQGLHIKCNYLNDERIQHCLKSLRDKKKKLKKEEYNIDNILEIFDVNIDTLNSYLNRIKKSQTKCNPILMKGNETLRSYCIKNGFNYDVINRAIKLHEFCENDTLEQLINRVIISNSYKNQKEPATWVYEKYGKLVKHILLYLKLDNTLILNNMSKYVISLEEAIRHDLFRLNVTDDMKWLEELYNYLIENMDQSKNQEELIEEITINFYSLVQTYNLKETEYNTLWNIFKKYIETIKEYQKVDVAFEKNYDKKLKKIKEYKLDEFEIEESFYIPLEFNNKVLLGKQNELYKRRQLIRQIIIDWNTYSDIEKIKIITEYKLTNEEIKLINEVRCSINETFTKIKG